MSISKLIIGHLRPKFPVIQGGMGVGVSLSSLAGSVAKCGGIGIISGAQIGYREKDFIKNTLEANLRALADEIHKARLKVVLCQYFGHKKSNFFMKLF